MQNSYKTVYAGGTGELIEKKSRFIADVEPVRSEEEALAFIEKKKKEYWDARHHCFAYVLGKNQQMQRFSDDGEPGGTAGKPILDVIMGSELTDLIVVVTRYFGGTLLGTGGLVRAYSGAAKEGLLDAEIIEKRYADRLSVTTDYNGIGKIQYLLAQAGMTTLSSDYSDIVRLEVLVPVETTKKLIADLTEGTNGRAQMEIVGQTWFAVCQGEILLFEE